MTLSDGLRERAQIHRTIHDRRVALDLGGTSEGAAKGWETRKAGGGGAAAKPEKKGFVSRIKDRIGKVKAAYARFEEQRKAGAFDSAPEGRRPFESEGDAIWRQATRRK